MKHVCGRVLAGLLIAGGCGAMAPACAHDDTTLFVRDVLAQIPVAAGQTCTFTSDPTQPFNTSGMLDISFRHEYEAIFLVGNQLVPEGNPSTPTTETSFINIQGAVVRVTDADGVQLNTFTRLTATTIAPSIGTTPSYAPISVTILDQTSVETPTFFNPIATQGQIGRLVTYTRFFGKTLGGQSVESNEFEFPVDVCRGCLIVFPQADIQAIAGLPQRNCFGSGSAPMSAMATTLPCKAGEDNPIECTQCPGVPDCLAVAPTVAPPPIDAGIMDAGTE